MNFFIKQGFAVAVVIGLLGCQNTNVDHGYGIVDFGAENSEHLKSKMNELINKKNVVVSIVQIGDVHSSTDYFIGPFRDFMQQRLGDAGIGWITLESTNKEVNTIEKWNAYRWKIIKNDSDHLGIQVGLASKKRDADLWSLNMLMKDSADMSIIVNDLNGSINLSYEKNNQPKKGWGILNAITKMPFNIEVANQSELTGLWLQKYDHAGVIVSSMNAQSSHLPSELPVTKSDLVIVEYGSKEVFDEDLDIKKYRRNLQDRIKKIRKELPKATILLLSPPDLMVNKKILNARCFDQVPASYDKVKLAQILVARSEKILYWDWQKAMGGRCNIANWYVEGLATEDYASLTPLGYEISAEMLYRSLIKYLNISRK